MAPAAARQKPLFHSSVICGAWGGNNPSAFPYLADITFPSPYICKTSAQEDQDARHYGPQNIRLVITKPSKMQIVETSLVRPLPHTKLRRQPLITIQELLPQCWDAYETTKDHVIFVIPQIEPASSSWTHPDPSIVPELYDPRELITEFEALLYTWGQVHSCRTAIIEL